MKPVVVIGAGLAGLRCAGLLHEAGLAVLLLEAEDEVGGRVRTYEHDGFLLDRGFQVLNTAYPEAPRALDLEALDLREFEPGALVHRNGKLHLVSDPFRQPGAALQSLLSPIGRLSDKLRVAWLRARVVRTAGRRLLAAPETTTERHLEELGFSDEMIDRFFRPFFGGVFLERRLETSSRWFELLFRQFALGTTTLPAGGMREIPLQLASRLPAQAIRRGARARHVDAERVVLESGETLEASAVVVATEEPAACAFLSEPAPPAWRSVSCHYYAATESPVERPILVLEGESSGAGDPLINSVCVPSQIAPQYAPAGQSLISVTTLSSDVDDAQVRHALQRWFGVEVRSWRLLRSVEVPYALPVQTPGHFLEPRLSVRRKNGIFVAGDHLETSSIHGALVSGRKTAAAVLESLQMLDGTGGAKEANA